MTTAPTTAPGYRRISIDPITRLEGHGKIDIFLDDQGDVADCFFQVPELRGFERFCEGRPVEEMPRITPRICGVCPEAHLMASAKACDAVYKVTIPLTARLIRELQYNLFFVTDHATHFYALAAPDFVMGPASDPAQRNIVGVIRKLGVGVGQEVIKARKWGHEAAAIIGGRPVNPENAIPGGVSKPISPDERDRLEEIARFMVEFGKFTLKVLDEQVLANQQYVDLILNGPYRHETYSMGLVDEKNHPNFYDGRVRVVDPEGKEFCKFTAREYSKVVAERVEPWSYLKFPYLVQVGWRGFVDGKQSGVYRATPQARLNVADSMGTPLAQAAYETYFETLTGDRSGRTPVHHTLAIHWARVVELVFAAERALELVRHPELTHPDHYRTIPTDTPTEGVGIVEAPRGTLVHHYVTDDQGIVRKANLVVGTTNNHAAICMSIKQAAQGLIKNGTVVTEGLLNMVEMAFRAYDPCFGCATHSLPGTMPLVVHVRDPKGAVVTEVSRQG
ncbi:MAG TPA: Ni/Fe hydrogenase subunit alpha [Vicinamibacterales bacterium]|nr:Ni/Fe hydrogenase subunit alpha [Vicinamibacterales bacterium]